jgi:predicted DNA-binding transcriptional regulator YafY
MTTREIVCSAARARHVIEFTYDGHTRVVEPYVVWPSKDDEWQLGGWLVGGYSASGSEPPWRCYNIASMLNVNVLEQTFSGDRPQYNRDADRYSEAFCKV